MNTLKTLIAVCAVALLLLGACSKTKKEEVAPTEQKQDNGTGGGDNEPEVVQIDTANTVFQQLISNFQGGKTLEVQSESNDVTFGLKFKSSKNGRIIKLRKHNGTIGTNLVKLWRYDSETAEYVDYKEQNVTSTSDSEFTGDVIVDNWEIEKDKEYIIGIRLFSTLTTPNKVLRFSDAGLSNIDNGSATVGPITFEKEFLYRTQSYGPDTECPEDIGTWKHFAGFLDFDFVYTE